MPQQKSISCLGLVGLLVWLMAATSSAGTQPQQTAAVEKNQGHYAYTAKRGKKWLVVADGKEGPEYEEAVTHRKQNGRLYRGQLVRGPEYFHPIGSGAPPPEPIDDETG